MIFKKNIHFVKLSLIYSFLIAVLFNYTVFSKLNFYFVNSPGHTLFESFFLLLVLLVLWSLLFIIFLILGMRYFLRPLIGFVLIMSSIIFYYKKTYGISVDEGIIVSGIDAFKEGNFNEIRDLFHYKIIAYIILMGIVPSIPLLFIRVKYPSLIKELITRVASIVLIILGLFALIFVNYKDVSITARVVKKLNQETIPHYSISSMINLVKHSFRKNIKFTVLDSKPSTEIDKPILGIVVVGETARADHFGLNGYHRNTTPLLEKQNITNYTNAKSCGTLTKVSVPCMFYLGDYDNYSERKARFQTNALDIASSAGVEVLWVENNSSCKNVCERIKKTIVVTDQNDTYDELLLEHTVKFINNLKNKNGLIVLHAMGSHGPKYFKRYPKQFEKFLPSCKSNAPQDCSREELINAYDNTILYTDFIVNSLIEILKKDNLNSFLIYASDHGESLGEKGLYLHGVPMRFAPKEQTHIPFLLWYSDSYKENNKIFLKNKNENITHEHFSHTILKSLKVKSTALKEEKSLLRLNQ
jgi:lipid A ethanolaminephosphotransferase